MSRRTKSLFGMLGYVVLCKVQWAVTKSRYGSCNEIWILCPQVRLLRRLGHVLLWILDCDCGVKKILTTQLKRLFFFISTFFKRFDTRWISISKTHNIKVFCISNTKIINQLFRFTSSFHMCSFHIRIRRGFLLFWKRKRNRKII